MHEREYFNVSGWFKFIQKSVPLNVIHTIAKHKLLYGINDMVVSLCHSNDFPDIYVSVSFVNASFRIE